MLTCFNLLQRKLCDTESKALLKSKEKILTKSALPSSHFNHVCRRSANRHPVWRVVISCEESFGSSRIVWNRQNFLHWMVQKILTIYFRSFHVLRTWKVHVVMFSYHATHVHSLLTCAPLDFRYVNVLVPFDLRHTMVISHIPHASRVPVC